MTLPRYDASLAAPAPRRSGRVLPGALLAVLALAAAAMVVVLVQPGTEPADAASAVLVPIGEPGTDPFAAAVAVTEVGTFPEAVEVVRPTPAASGPLEGTPVLDGTDPGVFGGIPDEVLCDVDALAGAYFDGAAAALAAVADIDAGDVPEYLDALTPVLLTADTWVIDHRLADGAGDRVPAVLQAGSSVLVDAEGVPRVRCLSGSPLLPPSGPVPADTVGEQWDGFDRDAVTAVQGGEPQVELTLVDVETGERYGQPVGGSIEVEGLVLEADGLGVVDLGDDADDAVDALTEALGAPDEQRSRTHGPRCTTDTRWWAWDDAHGDSVILELHQGRVVAYEVTNSGPDPTPRLELRTAEGLAPGATIDELRATYPDLEPTTGTAGRTAWATPDGLRFEQGSSDEGSYVEIVAAGRAPCLDDEDD